MNATDFNCFLVEKDATGKITRGMARQSVANLPMGEVLIRSLLSSLNYKDALACEAHPGIVRKLPHVPGIDAFGQVVESSDPRFRPNDAVIVTGNDLGSGQWGGWAEYIRVPATWVVPFPEEGMSPKESMILGTAGFTAAQCVDAIVRNGVKPDAGEIVVTGATGGVGCLAVKLLAKLGYTVVAVTGKPQFESRLKAWGASRIIGREDVLKPTDRALLSARWAGAVDAVGGDTLTTLLRETKPYGVVSACGLVGGDKLNLTVHPFILRGVILAGIGSALLPYNQRLEIWRKLSHEWRLESLDELATTVNLADVEPYVQRILKGEIVGRTVVRVASHV